MNRVSGKQFLNGSCSYVSQEHWIQNTKLMENVQFGIEFKGVLYDNVIDSLIYM
jgi:hypothetical protein